MADPKTGAHREAEDLEGKIKAVETSLDDVRQDLQANVRVTADYATDLSRLSRRLLRGEATDRECREAERRADGIDWLEQERRKLRDREQNMSARLQGLRRAYADLVRCRAAERQEVTP